MADGRRTPEPEPPLTWPTAGCNEPPRHAGTPLPPCTWPAAPQRGWWASARWAATSAPGGPWPGATVPELRAALLPTDSPTRQATLTVVEGFELRLAAAEPAGPNTVQGTPASRDAAGRARPPGA